MKDLFTPDFLKVIFSLSALIPIGLILNKFLGKRK